VEKLRRRWFKSGEQSEVVVKTFTAAIFRELRESVSVPKRNGRSIRT